VTQQAVIYLRASTDVSKQANSLVVQRSIIENFCSTYGYEIVGEFTEYASGKDDSRPEFNKALAVAVANNYKLVCFRIDRLARSMSIFSRINDHLHLLRFTELGDMEPNLMALSVMLAAAAQESINTGVRVRTTIKVLKERDPTRTFGNPRIRETAIPASLIVRQANAREFNQHIYSVVIDLRKAGYETTGSLVERLNSLGIRTRSGRLWSYHNLHRVIRRQQHETSQETL